MRYRLRTLLILLAVGPPVLARSFRAYGSDLNLPVFSGLIGIGVLAGVIGVVWLAFDFASLRDRPMLRFSIRDVLWLTALVSLGLGLGVWWWYDARAFQAVIRDHLAFEEEIMREQRGMRYAVHELGLSQLQQDKFESDVQWYIRGEKASQNEEDERLRKLRNK